MVAVLAACNQVYGLDETTVGETVFDSDGDGILDEDDNCVRVSNPDQADVDRNGQGDACSLVCLSGTRTNTDYDRDRVDDGCDPCPRSPQADAMGRPIDEDADGFVDACDNCPGRPNADQADGDGNGLGDVCDLAQARVLFDGFRTKQAYWGGPWKFEDGYVTSAGEELRLVGIELVNENPTQLWSVEVGIELPDVTTGTVGVFVRDGANKRGCALDRTATGWDLVTVGSTTTRVATPAMGLIRLRASLVTSGALMTRLRCDVADVSSLASTDAFSVAVSLSASKPTRFTYVDLAN